MLTIVLDDRDPAINYVGQWFQGGNEDTEYKGTTTFCTPAPDISAILVFVGTGVAVMGTIQAEDLQISSYSLDGKAAINFTSTKGSDSRFSQQFFSIGNLPNDNHTLVVAPIEGTLLLDLITVQQSTTTATAAAPISVTITVFTDTTTPEPLTPTPILNSTMQASVTTGQIGLTNTQNLTLATTSAPQIIPSNQQHEDPARRKASTNIWEIIGGISIGITALCLLILATYFGIRRRKAKSKGKTLSKPRTSVTPYDFISQSGSADVDLAGSESVYAPSGIADYGDTVMGIQNNYSPVVSTNGGRFVKAKLNRHSTGTGQDAPVRSDARVPSRGSTSPPPMYRTEAVGR